MEKPRGTPGAESNSPPPPYSSLEISHSREYGVRSPVLATAPYPVTPESDQVPYPVMIMPPPPYHFNPVPIGLSGNGRPVEQCNRDPIYNPAFYNPTVTVTPTSQRSTRWGNAGNALSRFCLMMVVIVIMIIVGIGASYYVKEVL